MRAIIALLLLLPSTARQLGAAWDFDILSGASEASLVTRLAAGTQYRYIAYRDQGGSLALRTYTARGPVTKVIWPGMAPAKTSLSVSQYGDLLITFWNGGKYYFAFQVGNGNGNCGPLSEFRCGPVLLPASLDTVGVLEDRIVGAVDGISQQHFVYRVRKAGISHISNGLYYVTRAYQGFWSTPVRISGEDGNFFSGDGPVPTDLGFAGNLTMSLFGGATPGFPPSRPALAQRMGMFQGVDQWKRLGPYFLPHQGQSTWFDQDNRFLGSGCHVVRQYDPGTTTLNNQHRIYYDYDFAKESVLVYGNSAQPEAAGRCAADLDTAMVPSVAFTTATGVVRVVKAAGGVNNPWTIETVDASAAFTDVQLGLVGVKRWLAYQGAGFVKVAREQ